MQEKIILAHPLQQHSYKTAEGLEEKKLLKKYITTVYYNKNKIVYRILEKILGKENIKRMHGRKNKVVEKYLQTYNDFLGLLYLFIFRIDKYKIIEPKMYSLLINRFGKNIYKYIKKNNEKYVIMYDTTAYKCFEMLSREKDIIKIIDMSSSFVPYVRELLLKEKNKKNVKYKKSLQVTLRAYSKSKCRKAFKELKYTNYFIVPSLFVKKSLLKYNVDKSSILTVPYGVDLSIFKQKEYNLKCDQLNFLFVGRLEYAKGIYYLLKAFEELKNINIQLKLVGSLSSKDKELINDIKKMNNVVYCGTKMKDEMEEMYNDADIYIMPSLFEGFSLTLLEAMAVGLPVIASKNSGAEGIIENYKQGFIIETASVEDLKEKILWFYNNNNKIPDMGIEARKLAMKYDWNRYKKALAEEISKKVME